jgi:type IV secretory pathway TraG/TraD family ATPase VirD4
MENKRVEVIILLDEFYQIGSLKAIENAMGMAAGYHVRLWPVLNDLGQLSQLYPRGWRTFLGNMGACIFYGPREPYTAQYMSDMAGTTERRTITKSISYQNDAEQQDRVKKRPQKQPNQNQANRNESRQDRGNNPRPANVNINFGTMSRPLLLPHEARELEGNEMLIWVEGVKGVIRARRVPYWEEPEFKGEFDPNPLENSK